MNIINYINIEIESGLDMKYEKLLKFLDDNEINYVGVTSYSKPELNRYEANELMFDAWETYTHIITNKDPKEE